MSSRIHFVDLLPPDVLWLAAGEEARVQATPGRRVKAGDLVAGVEHTSTEAVAPLAGEVGHVKRIVDTRGRSVEAVPVMLDDDAEHQPLPPGERTAVGTLSRDDLGAWISRLERAGVRADRHNSPDLIAQLVAAMRRPIDTVLCHALEADPTLPLQIQWALRHSAELRDGLRLISRLVNARRTLLAAPDGEAKRLGRHLRRQVRQASASAEMDEVFGATAGRTGGDGDAAGSEPLGLRLMPVLNAYPQADPTLLVYSLLSRRLPPGRLPTEAGVIVLDAVAAVAVGAVARGLSVVRREPVAVRDHRREVSVLADAWRGSRLIDVLQSLGLSGPSTDAAEPLQVRGGDYLRNHLVAPEAVVDGGEIVFHLEPQPAVPPPPPEPCIRCGWCLDICPTGVHPAGQLEAAQRQDAGLADRFGASACIECGLCSYICPSRLPLLEASVEGKRLLKA